MTASGSRRSPASTRATSKTSSSPMRWRSAAAPATNSPTRPRWSRTASSMSPIPGTCSTRSTSAPAMPAASSGAWTRSRTARCAPAARRCGAISSSPAPAVRQRAAHHRDQQGHRHGGVGVLVPDTPDVTFTAAPLAIKDKIIVGAANGDQGVRDWIAGLDAATGKRCGANSPFRRPASPAARPGRTIPTPGRPAAARCG